MSLKEEADGGGMYKGGVEEVGWVLCVEGD